MSSRIGILAAIVGAMLILGLLAFRRPSEELSGTVTGHKNANESAPTAPEQVRPQLSRPQLVQIAPRIIEKRDDFKELNAEACWDSCGSPCAAVVDQEAMCPTFCESNDDCEEWGQVCWTTATTDYDAHRSKRCQKSQCESDDDCGADKTCVEYSKSKEFPFNACQEAGRRLVGEPCFGDEYGALGQCERGLHCIYGVCGIQQDCDVSADCQPGMQCFHRRESSSCVPGCTTNEDCPGSTECLASGSDGRLQCLDRDSFGCIFEGCDAGLDCVRYTDSPAMAATACQAPCESDSECSEGEFCGSLKFSKNGTSKHCFQKCDPVPCKEGWLCVQNAIVREREEITACYLDADEQKRAFMRGFDPPPE